MVFCRGCGKEIHESAPACPHCGAPQGVADQSDQRLPAGSIWMAITSLVLGIVCVVAFFDDSPWDKDTILGLGMFAVAGLAFGVVSLSNQSAGKGMAISGVVMSGISLLAYIGMAIK